MCVMQEGMLARLAAVLQQGGQIPGVVGEDGIVVVDQENCLVCLSSHITETYLHNQVM